MKIKKTDYISNIKLISKDSNLFPKKLLDLPDCPDMLFLLGNERILNDPSVSIVGTRKSSKLGNELSFNLSNTLSSYKINIVSGMAKGIDTYAHKGTFNVGKSIAIIACGFNYLSTISTKEISSEILKNGGAIISEYFPDTPPKAFTFLRRNRLIATLTNITIVVEAPIQSGALNTAQTAIEHNREVFSIPWNLNLPNRCWL